MDELEDVELSDEFLRLIQHAGNVFVEANAERNVNHLDNIMINCAMLTVLAALKYKNSDRRRAEKYIAGLLMFWDEINVSPFPK